jgi:hypothetical protein
MASLFVPLMLKQSVRLELRRAAARSLKQYAFKEVGRSSSSKQACEQGSVYFVATPIGNLGVISSRALDVLSQCVRLLTAANRTQNRCNVSFVHRMSLLQRTHVTRELYYRTLESRQSNL